MKFIILTLLSIKRVVNRIILFPPIDVPKNSLVHSQAERLTHNLNLLLL